MFKKAKISLFATEMSWSNIWNYMVSLMYSVKNKTYKKEKSS